MTLEERIAEARREIRHSPLVWEDGNTAQEEGYENGYDFGFNDGMKVVVGLLRQEAVRVYDNNRGWVDGYVLEDEEN